MNVCPYFEFIWSFILKKEFMLYLNFKKKKKKMCTASLIFKKFCFLNTKLPFSCFWIFIRLICKIGLERSYLKSSIPRTWQLIYSMIIFNRQPILTITNVNLLHRSVASEAKCGGDGGLDLSEILTSKNWKKRLCLCLTLPKKYGG